MSIAEDVRKMGRQFASGFRDMRYQMRDNIRTTARSIKIKFHQHIRPFIWQVIVPVGLAARQIARAVDEEEQADVALLAPA